MNLESFHALSKSITDREIKFRDNFWKDRIPRIFPGPNFLTIIRIIGSLFLIFSTIHNKWFFIVIIFLFLTDYFDGIIARTQNKETLFGKWADPIADRLLLVSIIYTFYLLNTDFWNKFILKMMMPEIFILVIGLILLILKKSITPKPNLWGRLKFTFYFLGIIFFLINNYLLANICISIGIIFAIFAVLNYFSRIYEKT